MKTVGGILFGIGMALLWSAVFVTTLGDWTGVIIGVAFGISMGSCMTIALNSSGKKEKKSNQEESESGVDGKK